MKTIATTRKKSKPQARRRAARRQSRAAIRAALIEHAKKHPAAFLELIGESLFPNDAEANE